MFKELLYFSAKGEKAANVPQNLVLCKKKIFEATKIIVVWFSIGYGSDLVFCAIFLIVGLSLTFLQIGKKKNFFLLKN